MRRILVVSILLSLAAGVFALPPGGASTVNSEIAAILDQNAQAQLGTMTVGELNELAGDISIAIQKEQYVRRAAMASMVMPGAGQLRNGDWVGGTLFIAGDLALLAGTLVGAYYLLPANVQFGSLDYLGTPLSAIGSTWESNTLVDYAPSIAVAVGGMAARLLLRWVASVNAEAEARTAIESGKVTFKPDLVPLFGPIGHDGRMGIGFGLRWR